jgi:hypothetical protein
MGGDSRAVSRAARPLPFAEAARSADDAPASQNPNTVVLTLAHEFRVSPHAASPLLVVNFWDELSSSKDIVLIRATIMPNQVAPVITPSCRRSSRRRAIAPSRHLAVVSLHHRIITSSRHNVTASPRRRVTAPPRHRATVPSPLNHVRGTAMPHPSLKKDLLHPIAIPVTAVTTKGRAHLAPEPQEGRGEAAARPAPALLRRRRRSGQGRVRG